MLQSFVALNADTRAVTLRPDNPNFTTVTSGNSVVSQSISELIERSVQCRNFLVVGSI